MAKAKETSDVTQDTKENGTKAENAELEEVRQLQKKTRSDKLLVTCTVGTKPTTDIRYQVCYLVYKITLSFYKVNSF